MFANVLDPNGIVGDYKSYWETVDECNKKCKELEEKCGFLEKEVKLRGASADHWRNKFFNSGDGRVERLREKETLESNCEALRGELDKMREKIAGLEEECKEAEEARKNAVENAKYWRSNSAKIRRGSTLHRERT